ncbi:hypothetical protein E2C01_072175 [Portunus trituberculatus]|uniref:Uncharacterized protein n=1 Tax=Portunus trituberculatus TaxID=210409 RepID=A0A5B7HXA8_PORTR|nr:hypothetical protein [Portunus trituberculatus]
MVKSIIWRLHSQPTRCPSISTCPHCLYLDVVYASLAHGGPAHAHPTRLRHILRQPSDFMNGALKSFKGRLRELPFVNH